MLIKVPRVLKLITRTALEYNNTWMSAYVRRQNLDQTTTYPKGFDDVQIKNYAYSQHSAKIEVCIFQMGRVVLVLHELHTLSIESTATVTNLKET